MDDTGAIQGGGQTFNSIAALNKITNPNVNVNIENPLIITFTKTDSPVKVKVL